MFMSKKNEKKIKRVDLKDDYKERFEQIKEEGNFESDAAVVRALINQYKKGIYQIDIEKEIFDRISQELENPFFRIRYGIFSPDNFVLKAIINFFGQIKKEKGSLLDWDVRSQLTPKQRSIAIAFLELQNNNPKGISKNQIAEFLNVDENDLDNDLKYLIHSGLIENHGKLYYAP